MTQTIEQLTARVRELETQLAANNPLLDEAANRIDELEAENARLSDGVVCGDCDGSGWLENRVEGRYPCTCMTEAEPYQLLAEQLAAAQKEIERLKATPPDKREDLRCVISDLCRQVQERDAKLASSEQLAAVQEQIANETAWQPIETAPKKVKFFGWLGTSGELRQVRANEGWPNQHGLVRIPELDCEITLPEGE